MRRHRAAIGYELSAADTLPGPVLSTGTGGALLRPVTPHRRPLRIVDAATAELFAELRAPGIVAAETSSPNHLARLVLDGVLEVETDLGWTSGPAAHPLYFAASREIPSHGPIARLSLEGIEYAAALRLRDAATIADRLYRWNTLPDTPAWRRRVPTPAA
ncbi:MAG: hypothetical protein ABJD11_11105, partial [Gemmatimonadota bacterium]